MLKAGAQWEILSVNDIEEEEVHATPELIESQICIPTRAASKTVPSSGNLIEASEN